MLPKSILLDADVLISYLTRDILFESSVKVIKHIVEGATTAYVS